MGRSIPITILTDPKSLFDFILKVSTTTKKRLAIYLKAVTESYRTDQISEIGFISRHFNAAGALTKMKPNASLERYITGNELNHPIHRWVIRSSSINEGSHSLHTIPLQTDSKEEDTGNLIQRDDYDSEEYSYYYKSDGKLFISNLYV